MIHLILEGISPQLAWYESMKEHVYRNRHKLIDCFEMEVDPGERIISILWCRDTTHYDILILEEENFSF